MLMVNHVAADLFGGAQCACVCVCGGGGGCHNNLCTPQGAATQCNATQCQRLFYEAPSHNHTTDNTGNVLNGWHTMA